MGAKKRRQSRSLGKSGPALGLTGSLASGKSTALKAFRKLGWKTASADDLVTEIYKEKAVRKEDLIKRFGKSAAGLKRLERWIHPLVRKKIFKFMKKARHGAVVEIPLLFEGGLQKYFDFTIFVDCPRAVRRRRALKRGMSPELFDFLDAQQFSREKKMKLADLVLKNKSKADLKKTIGVLFSKPRSLKFNIGK